MRYPVFLLLVISVLLVACEPSNNGEQAQRTTTSTPDTPAAQPQLKEQPRPRQKVPSAGIKEDYTNTDRVIWQKPEMVLELLGDVADKVVADIGAGTGFFALRLARRTDKVIAIDIDPRFIDYLDSVKVFELPERYQENLEPRLAQPSNPMLQENEVDVIIIVNTYMYIPKRKEYLGILKRALKPGGRLLIIDFKKKRTPVGPPSRIRVPLYEVEEELYAAGFSQVQTNDTALDYQYILIASTSGEATVD